MSFHVVFMVGGLELGGLLLGGFSSCDPDVLSKISKEADRGGRAVNNFFSPPRWAGVENLLSIVLVPA